MTSSVIAQAGTRNKGRHLGVALLVIATAQLMVVLDWTIVKPGHLTDAPGSGRVQVSRTFGRRADVPRDDVALVLLECLGAPNTIGVEFELFEGDVPAREAVRSL